jgi:hypothetical protein
MYATGSCDATVGLCDATLAAAALQPAICVIPEATAIS